MCIPIRYNPINAIVFNEHMASICAAGGRGERGPGHLAARGLAMDVQLLQVRMEQPGADLGGRQLVLRGCALDHHGFGHVHHHRILRLLRHLDRDFLPALERAPLLPDP